MTDSNRRFLAFFSGSVSEFRTFLGDLADLDLLDQVELTASIGRHPAGKGLRQADAACCAAHDGPHVHGCTRRRRADGRTHPGACVVDPVEAAAEWAHGEFCPWCNGRRTVEECTAIVEAEQGAR